jgi:hypothetical protein
MNSPCGVALWNRLRLGALGREIETGQGICRLVDFKEFFFDRASQKTFSIWLATSD